MAKTYDLVIIGSGTAAQVASARVRAAGWEIAVVDHRPFGGTCALRGCDPKKMLISGAEAIDAASRMRGHGVSGDLRVDWRELMAFKRSFTDPVPQKQEQRYAANGIDAFHGLARFTGPDAVSVEEQELEARHILIAAGARPRPWLSPARSTSRPANAFSNSTSCPPASPLSAADTSPRNSHSSRREAGARVTVFQRGERMLPAFDPDSSVGSWRSSASSGIDVRTGSTVERIDKTAAGYLVHASTDGQAQTAAADLVVHAAGRVPDLYALDLAAGNVVVEKGRPKLNDFLQSVSNRKIYAAGDAARNGPPLTPISTLRRQGRCGKPARRQPAQTRLPGRASVAFTIPPIAAVGLSESEAKAKGIKFRMNSEKASDWYTARRFNERVYGFKTLVDPDTGHS